MEKAQFDQLLQFFKVLGNESRLKIIGLLANDERSVGELASLLELREPTVSHHLAVMKELGLVQVRADGNLRFYRLDNKFLEKMSRDLFSQDHLAELVPDPGGDAWENRVLRTYLQGDRIREIPLKRKKRHAVLKWLVQRFEMDREYEEIPFSEALQAYNSDYASLRRYLVEHKLMARKRGVYWRLPLEEADWS